MNIYSLVVSVGQELGSGLTGSSGSQTDKAAFISSSSSGGGRHLLSLPLPLSLFLLLPDFIYLCI